MGTEKVKSGYKSLEGWKRFLKHQRVCLVQLRSYENVNQNLTRNDSVLSEFKPGDHFRFMRNIGGSGGHSLHVRNFKALVELQDHY